MILYFVKEDSPMMDEWLFRGVWGNKIENKIIFKSNVIISLLNMTIKKIYAKIERFGFYFVLFGVIGRGENNFYEFLRKIMFNVFLHSKLVFQKDQIFMKTKPFFENFKKPQKKWITFNQHSLNKFQLHLIPF